MKGRDKCELLNEVRQKIAEKNNIEFTVYECTFEGDCTGTCPKCESEVRYLEEELTKKQARGEKINLEGIFNIEETCPTYIGESPPTDILLGKPATYIERPLGDIAPNPFNRFLNNHDNPDIKGLFKYLKDIEFNNEDINLLFEKYGRMMEFNVRNDIKVYDKVLKELENIQKGTDDEKERILADHLIKIGRSVRKPLAGVIL